MRVLLSNLMICLVPRTHVAEGENWLLQIVLWLLPMCSIHSHIHIQNKYKWVFLKKKMDSHRSLYPAKPCTIPLWELRKLCESIVSNLDCNTGMITFCVHMWLFLIIWPLVLRRSHPILGFWSWKGKILSGICLSRDGIGFRSRWRGLLLLKCKEKEKQLFKIVWKTNLITSDLFYNRLKSMHIWVLC